MDITLKENERWVERYGKRYTITSEGVVTSYVRKLPKIMSGFVLFDAKRNRNQYRAVLLSNKIDGKSVQRQEYIHRLVAEAFLPNPERKPCVNHKDGDKLNNNVDNLEWVTYSENITHAYAEGLLKGRFLKEDEKARRKNVLIFQSYVKEYKSVLSGEDLVSAHIPAEIITISCIKNCYLDTWNYYIDLFKLCDDSSLSLSRVAAISGLDPSMVSKLRNGKRGVDARKIYDKYKNDTYYFTNYKNVLYKLE